MKRKYNELTCSMWLEDLFEQTELTYKQISDITGLAYSTLMKIKKNNVLPNRSTIIILLNFFEKVINNFDYEANYRIYDNFKKDL